MVRVSLLNLPPNFSKASTSKSTPNAYPRTAQLSHIPSITPEANQVNMAVPGTQISSGESSSLTVYSTPS